MDTSTPLRIAAPIKSGYYSRSKGGVKTGTMDMRTLLGFY
jgi:hypothetical protein